MIEFLFPNDVDIKLQAIKMNGSENFYCNQLIAAIFVGKFDVNYQKNFTIKAVMTYNLPQMFVMEKNMF